MSLTRDPGRVAGFTYLLLAVIGPFHLIYIPSVFFRPGDAAATVDNIAAHELLFRIGIVSGLAEAVTFIFVAMALYRLLSGVGRNLAVLMVIFVLISAAIGCVNELTDLAALTLARGPDLSSVFGRPQRDSLAMFFIDLRGQGMLVNELLWGLWLFPLAMLVYRSRFIPRFLGGWLLLNGLAYVVTSLTGLLRPQGSAIVSKIAAPALFGELALVLWLVIKGAQLKVLPSEGAA